MITFEATKTIFPEVVANCPEVFVIVLVAIRFVRYIEPVDMEPPVLSMVTLDMLKLVTLSATKLLVTYRLAISRALVVKFVARTVSAYIRAVLMELATTVLILR
jgi:hypothetical protein